MESDISTIPGAIESRHQETDFAGSQKFEVVRFVINKTYSFLDLHFVTHGIQPKYLDLAGIPVEQVHDEPEGRCLAGAIRANEAHNEAAGHTERYIVENKSFELFSKVMNFQYPIHSFSSDTIDRPS